MAPESWGGCDLHRPREPIAGPEESRTDGHGSHPFRFESVNVVESVAGLKPVDALLLATKLYDLEEAAAATLPALSRTGAAIAVQNGVSSYRVLSSLLPSDRIAVGPVYALAKMTGPASVAYGGIERAVLGSPTRSVHPSVTEVVRLWRQAGIDASIAEDINNVLWTKFIGLATSAAMNCISKLPAGIVYHDKELLELGSSRSTKSLQSVRRRASSSSPPWRKMFSLISNPCRRTRSLQCAGTWTRAIVSSWRGSAERLSDSARSTESRRHYMARPMRCSGRSLNWPPALPTASRPPETELSLPAR